MAKGKERNIVSKGIINQVLNLHLVLTTHVPFEVHASRNYHSQVLMTLFTLCCSEL